MGEFVEHLCEGANGLLAYSPGWGFIHLDVGGRFGEIGPDKQAAYGTSTLVNAILGASALGFLDDRCIFCIGGRVRIGRFGRSEDGFVLVMSPPVSQLKAGRTSLASSTSLASFCAFCTNSK